MIFERGFLICIDTDCSRGGWLTGLDVGNLAVIQANQLGDVQRRQAGRWPAGRTIGRVASEG
jgi:hypothetical protein